MNEQTIQLISQLANRLGTTADHLWAVLAKQAIVQAIQSSVWAVIWVIIATIGWVFLKKFWIKIWEEEEFGAILIGIGACILTAIALIQIGIAFDNVITTIFNPEYYSFKQMTELVKPAK